MFGKTSKLTFFYNELETPQNLPERLRKLIFPSGGIANGVSKLFLFPYMSDGNPSRGFQRAEAKNDVMQHVVECSSSGNLKGGQDRL